MEKEEKFITLIDGIEPLLAYKDRWVRKDSKRNIINEVLIKEKPQWLLAYVTDWRPEDEYLTEEGHAYYEEYITREHLRIAAGWVEELSDFEDENENNKPTPSPKPSGMTLTTGDDPLYKGSNRIYRFDGENELPVVSLLDEPTWLISHILDGKLDGVELTEEAKAFYESYIKQPPFLQYLIRKTKRSYIDETVNDDKYLADYIRVIAECYCSLIEQGMLIFEDNTDSINEETYSDFPFVISDFRDSFNDRFRIPYQFSADKSFIENIIDFLYYYQKLAVRARYGRLRSLINKAEKELKEFVNKTK
jgi:hypothetical protein